MKKVATIFVDSMERISNPALREAAINYIEYHWARGLGIDDVKMRAHGALLGFIAGWVAKEKA